MELQDGKESVRRHLGLIMRCGGAPGSQPGATGGSASFSAWFHLLVQPEPSALLYPRQQSCQELTRCSSPPAGPGKGGKALFHRGKSRREHKDGDNPLGGIRKLQTSHKTLAGAAHSLVPVHRDGPAVIAADQNHTCDASAPRAKPSAAQSEPVLRQSALRKWREV